MFSNEIEELVHLYEDGAFSRRELWKRVAGITGSAATAATVLTALAVPEEAAAQQCEFRVPADAPDVESVLAEFPGAAGRLYGYLSVPRKEFTAQMPAVLVIHENRGLTEHIKDVTRRIARAGYVGLGIDLLSRQGGTDAFPDPAGAAAAYGRVTAAGALEDCQSAIAYLRTLGIVKANRIGTVGFCAGGGHVFNVAVSQPDLAASVVYYGAVPASLDLLENVTAPILMHYGELDRNFAMAASSALTQFVQRRKTFELHVWEGAAHAFNNDTGANYNPTVACEAWEKTLAFYGRHLLKAD